MAPRPALTRAHPSRSVRFREMAATTASPAAAAELLAEARDRTLALVAPLSDADVETAHSTLMSPLVWDLAHIAAYEELWLVHRHGGEPLVQPELSAMYDAFETPRAVRGTLPLLDREQALDYLATVRERTLAVLERRGAGNGELLELVLRHEHQHGETMLQAIERARLLPAPAIGPAPRPGSPGGHTGLEAVEVPAGPCSLGTGPDGFAYDNERPRHVVELPAFRIGRTPITNATWLNFAEGGGYERREWWSDEGWAWKEDYDITHPEGWAHGPAGWRRWRLDGWAPLHPDEPVVHVSWFEADAFARAHGARLPTEAEWEKAATWDQDTETARSTRGATRRTPSSTRTSTRRRSARTRPARSPAGRLALRRARDARRRVGVDRERVRRLPRLRGASLPRVLRGVLRPRLQGAARRLVGEPRRASTTATMRNWDLPLRRQIFSGVRLAWDA